MLKTKDLIEVADIPLSDRGELLTIDELAKRMKVSRWKIRDLYQHEGLPKVDLHGLYRFDWEAVRVWIKTRISSNAMN